MCAFPNACTVVFKNRQENRQWAYFSQPGSLTPVDGAVLGAVGWWLGLLLFGG